MSLLIECKNLCVPLIWRYDADEYYIVRRDNCVYHLHYEKALATSM
jgi:hypothetical protein